MDSRAIRQKMMELQAQLNAIEAKEEAKRKAEEAVKQAAIIQQSLVAVKRWYAACDTLDIATIKELLPSIATYQGQYDNSNFREYHDDDCKKRCYQRAIMCAIESDHDELLKLVLTKAELPRGYPADFILNRPCALFNQARYDNNICYPLIYAILKKSEKCAALLINQGAQVNIYYCNVMHYSGAALNENQLLGTALTCAIQQNLTQTAQLLIAKGAAVGSEYREEIRNWLYGDHGYDRNCDKTFDDSSSPFLLAVTCKNAELITYFLEQDADLQESNRNGINAFHLASDEIKKILLPYYTYAERLQNINFKGEIPAQIRCAISGVIMKNPVSYKFPCDREETIFCKDELIKLNTGRPFTGKMLGPHDKSLNLACYTAILALPIKEELVLMAREFVENAETKAANKAAEENQRLSMKC